MKTTIITMTSAFLPACGQAFAAYSPELQAKAEQGDAAAQYELGKCYWCGEGVEKDLIQAARWLCKALEQDDDNDSFLYILDEIKEELRQAAEKGDAEAQAELRRLESRE